MEKRLAKRHLKDGDLVLYDLTSSYFEGVTCPLAKLGKSRDRKRNTLQVNYGIVSSREGCPVSLSVYEGNTGDPTTLMEQARKARDDFGIGEMVQVGDRGMITQKQIDELRHAERFDWITAMKTGGIRNLVEGGALQLDLFDERNIFEFTHPDYPGERLMACRNPVLGRKRAHKRESMLEATKRELSKIRIALEKGTLKKEERTIDRIGMRVGTPGEVRFLNPTFSGAVRRSCEKESLPARRGGEISRRRREAPRSSGAAAAPPLPASRG